MTHILIFLCSFTVTAVTVPLLMKVANDIGFLDRPTKRKQHKISVPLVGGICMFAGFAAAFFVFVGAGEAGSSERQFAYILLGGLAILVIGVVDDYFKAIGKEFPVWPRTLVYIGAATLVFAIGVRFTGLFIPFTDNYIAFPIWLQYVLTVMWIFGVITIVNWSDGLDGLAGSLCAITSVTFFVVALYMGEPLLASLTLILVGVTTGFLKYNLFPAKIFMGDSGTTFLGYIIAVLSVYGLFKQATVISIFIPVLALGVPMFDSLFVAVRRILNKQAPYKADRTHMHHRLLRWGLTPFQAFLFLVLLSVVLNLGSIIMMLVGID
jgi:UDP-N-acetylmuramyl pentapeptide phosphotransferase/UDP-N-acetylglucosamine-1-phosphate transferase